jgi:hypothetical protein
MICRESAACSTAFRLDSDGKMRFDYSYEELKR